MPIQIPYIINVLFYIASLMCSFQVLKINLGGMVVLIN